MQREVEVPSSVGTKACGPGSTPSQWSQSATASPVEEEQGSGGSAGGEASRLWEETAEQARELAGDVVHAVEDTAHRAREQGQEAMENQKSRLSDQAAHYGDTVHRLAEQLREEDDAALARIADNTAEQLDRLAHYLRRRDLHGLYEDVQDLARRRSDLVFSGLFVGGLALARFLKASGRRRSPRERQSAGATRHSSLASASGQIPGTYQETAATSPQTAAGECSAMPVESAAGSRPAGTQSSMGATPGGLPYAGLQAGAGAAGAGPHDSDRPEDVRGAPDLAGPHQSPENWPTHNPGGRSRSASDPNR